MSADIDSVQIGNFYKSPTWRKSENRSVAKGTAKLRCSIEIPVTALDHSSRRIRAVVKVERIDGRKHAIGRDLEQRSVKPKIPDRVMFGHTIKVSVFGLNKRADGRISVGATCERINRRQRSFGGEF